jgi:hypothetical protein
MPLGLHRSPVRPSDHRRPRFLSRAIGSVLGKMVRHRTGAYLTDASDKTFFGLVVLLSPCADDRSGQERAPG